MRAIVVIFFLSLCAVFSAPINEANEMDKSEFTSSMKWFKKLPVDEPVINEEVSDDVDKRAGVRNPYSWLNQIGRIKRSRNPYSWMAMSNLDDEPPITYGWLKSMSKKSRNQFSWNGEPKRTRNPYSWMNYVN